MELEKNILMNDLLDMYGKLLTENQLNIMECYYREDLSLQEIASNLDITRSAVFDTIKKAENILVGYEEKLGLLKKDKIKNEIIENIDSLSKEEMKELLLKL